MRLDPVFVWTLRIALAALFAAAAVHKLRDPRGFAATLADYRILPTGLVTAAMIALAGCESLLALGFLLRADAKATGLVAAALLSLYSVAIAVNLRRGRRDIACGCLGPAGRSSLSPGLLARNAVLLLAALATTLPATPRSLHWIDGPSLIGGALVLGLLFQAVNTLMALGWLGPDRENAS